MANKGKRMVNEDLIKYLEAVKTNNPDPSDIGGGGTDFTATNGLLLQEIEGENYLGIDPAANIKGQLVFTTTDNNYPAITINALNNTNTDINFKSIYDTGETANRGRLRYVQGLNGHFELGSIINGSYATVKTPNANTLLEEDWPVTRTVAVGAKSGDTKVYAGNDDVIDLSNIVSGSNTNYYIVNIEDDSNTMAVNPIRFNGNIPVELFSYNGIDVDFDTLSYKFSEYQAGTLSPSDLEYYQGNIDLLYSALDCILFTNNQGYTYSYLPIFNKTSGAITNYTCMIYDNYLYHTLKLINTSNSTSVFECEVNKDNGVNKLNSITIDTDVLSYIYFQVIPLTQELV